MNIAKIYNNAIKPESPEVEPEDESLQIIVSDRYKDWLNHPLTQDLFQFLLETKNTLLQECVNCVESEQKVKAKLHKVKQLEEVIAYGTNPSRNSTVGK